ncbi:MAG: hypothetical protein U1E42_12285 [Rhodospirillales bacterium]
MGEPDWSALSERGSFRALSLIHWIATAIGRQAGRALLYPISLYFLLTAAPQRRASRAYLRRVLGERAGWPEVLRHIHTFAATILDRAFLLGGQFGQFDFRIHGGEIVLEQVRSKKGCLLLGSHLGSFEALRVLGTNQLHFPLRVLMDVGHNPTITRFFNALNPDIAETIIPVRGPNTLIEVKERLEEGYVIGTLGDRVLNREKSLSCRFLGDDARFPVGPILIAAITRCPVILAFALYAGGNRYEIYFERLTDDVAAKHRGQPEAIHGWLQQYADRLAHYTRLFPYNWFNFFDFWGDDVTNERSPKSVPQTAGHG